MGRCAFLLGVIALVAACGGRERNADASAASAGRAPSDSVPIPISAAANTSAPQSPLARELFAKSRLLEGDTIHIWTATTWAVDWPLAGEEVDSTLYGEVARRLATIQFRPPEGYPSVFAVGRVPLAPDITGFLVRAPGQHWPSRIDLWIYDARRQELASRFRLAEYTGDEGYYVDEQSWFVDLNGDGSLDLVQRHRSTEHDAERDTTFIRGDDLFVRYWRGGAFDAARVPGPEPLRSRFLMPLRPLPGS